MSTVEKSCTENCRLKDFMMTPGKVIMRSRIDISTRRQLTFSKRRSGLLKKARELALLCDAEVGLIIFSASGRKYEYSSTCMKSIVERYKKHKEKNLDNVEAQDKNVWHKEVTCRKLHFECLQDCYRLLSDEDISRLNLKDLHQFEQQLQTNIQSVRERKKHVLMDEIQQRSQMERYLEEENAKLRKKISAKELPGKNINCGKEEESDCGGASAKSLASALQLW